MTEQELREKIIGIVLDVPITGIKIREILGGEATANVIADAIISEGIGDVKEAEHRAEVAEKERNEWEHKTEIAQKAGKIIQRDMLRIFGSENPVINDKINALWDLALQQAEREIEENALRQALLTVEEERKDD